jgi:transcriptional regulator with XRE-family HTH domain
MTNAQFAEHVGDITISYASYLRSGSRLPSAGLLIRIIKVFKLDPNEAMTAYQKDEAVNAAGERPDKGLFGAYLRENVFGDPAPDDSPVTE